MALLTDFFVASPAELQDAFPSLLPVADKPAFRESVNPFTGAKQQVKYWPAAASAVSPKAAPKKARKSAPAGKGSSHDITALPHVMWKNVDQLKLATLWGMLDGTEVSDALEAMSRPPLVEPQPNTESGLVLLSEAFVSCLAVLSDADVKVKAKEWAQTDDWAANRAKSKDLVEILTELRRLASKARKDQKHVYLWWSL